MGDRKWEMGDGRRKIEEIEDPPSLKLRRTGEDEDEENRRMNTEAKSKTGKLKTGKCKRN